MDACAHLSKVLSLACVCLVLAALCDLHVKHKGMFKWTTGEQIGVKDVDHISVKSETVKFHVEQSKKQTHCS